MSWPRWVPMWLLPGLLLWLGPLKAEPLRVAVASNFVATLHELATSFTAQTGHQVMISSGSTGQLYAQIKQGAPFDVFLAADTLRPQKLVDEGLAVELEIYATGILVLYVRQAPDADCATWLGNPVPGFLAVANPDLAPYGQAAQDYLQHQNLWESWQKRLVMGENIAQTSHFVATGAAAAGLLAQATVRLMPPMAGSCVAELPAAAHPPIEQAVVNLKRSQNGSVVAAFRRYLHSAEAQQLIVAHGYRVGVAGD